jgi:aryl-alcohol dehydrogenase-like predicted oxidoreductase
MVKFRDGIVAPVLGQGSGHVGQGRRPVAVEEEALRAGVSLGMALIDTAESYGEGHSEELISHVIAGRRDRVFLASKVETNHATGEGIARACEASLARLGTDYLDLYLLHWPVPSAEFSGVVVGFGSLRAAGKIRAWGVSNFTVRQMEDLFQIPQGDRCATNQVPYNLDDCGIEHELLRMAKKLNPQQEREVIPRWRSLIGYLLLPPEVDHGVLVTDRRGRGSSWSGHASWHISPGP